MVVQRRVAQQRCAIDWSGRGHAVRLLIGLEDAGGLLRDLAAGFAAIYADDAHGAKAPGSDL